MTHHNHCLNCGKHLTDKYCAGCGQKADTHRITFKHFLLHDLLHGTFHIDKGILYTAKQSITRPGQAALDYISGKRIRFYNVFYLILITLGLMLFVRHIDDLFNGTEPIKVRANANEATRNLDKMFAEKSKFLILLFLPFAAINSFILFRKRKLNLSEHTIIAGMLLLGIAIIGVCSNVLFIINMGIGINGTILSLMVTAVNFIYVGYGYYNAFGKDYSGWGISSRVAAFFVFICIEVLLLLMVLIGIATHWKFTEITISPFGYYN
ncbi:MAG: DUF3667 domain-containing protein [Bacteroidota bacterium]